MSRKKMVLSFSISVVSFSYLWKELSANNTLVNCTILSNLLLGSWFNLENCAKVQRTLRKIKSKLPEKVYKKLYPTGSYPVKFYGNKKVRELSTNNIDDITLSPIMCNIDTVTYEMAKYLTDLLAPLNKSEYKFKKSKESLKYMENPNFIWCEIIVHKLSIGTNNWNYFEKDKNLLTSQNKKRKNY